jgi:hypothetical protein
MGATRWPEAVEHMLAMPLGRRALRRILWDNPAAFYGLG